jgi:acetylglutamate kinase
VNRVIKVGGRSQSDPDLPAALAALVGEPRAWACVVHGGGDEVTSLQRRLGLEPRFSGGRRVTSVEDLEIVRMVLSGSANKRLVARLLSLGVRAVGLSGEDGGLLSARAVDAARMGRVGGAVSVDPAVVRHLLAGGFVPVVSPIARDAESPEGAALNVNGDDAAAALAVALEADELVLVADVAGVLDGDQVIPALDVERAAQLVSEGVAGGGMAAKLEAATHALHRGVGAVRIVNVAGIRVPTAGTRLVPAPAPVHEAQ